MLYKSRPVSGRKVQWSRVSRVAVSTFPTAHRKDESRNMMHPKNSLISRYRNCQVSPPAITFLSCSATGGGGRQAGRQEPPRNRLPIRVVLVRCSAVGTGRFSSFQSRQYCSSPTRSVFLPRPHLSTIAASYRQASHIPETFHCVRTHVFLPSSINTLHPTRRATTPGAALELPVQFGSPVQSAAHYSILRGFQLSFLIRSNPHRRVVA